MSFFDVMIEIELKKKEKEKQFDQAQDLKAEFLSQLVSDSHVIFDRRKNRKAGVPKPPSLENVKTPWANNVNQMYKNEKNYREKHR